MPLLMARPLENVFGFAPVKRFTPKLVPLGLTPDIVSAPSPLITPEYSIVRFPSFVSAPPPLFTTISRAIVRLAAGRRAPPFRTAFRTTLFAVFVHRERERGG